LPAGMWRRHVVILTSVSWFAVVAAIAGCDTPTKPGTSLAGSTACDGTTCGSGQLCKDQFSGAPDGGVSTFCIDIPAGCTVFDCHGSQCPPCVAEMCAGFPEVSDLIAIDGRTLTCPGI